jgi:predicted MFS family arabinose efflux permease
MAGTEDAPKVRAFEWWMISNFAMGAGFAAFVSLLIPPYVTEITGKASEAGVVMAVISLAALAGPVLGGFADKFRAHRLVMVLGLFGSALAFAMYAISSESSAILVLDAIILGVAIAAQQALAPVFVVGAGLPKAAEAKQLTTLNLVYPVGQVVGGALLGAAVAAGMDYTMRFWVAAAFMFVGGLITWFTSGDAAKRIKTDVAADDGSGKASYSLKSVFISIFGVYLLILVLSSVTNNGINAQIANIMPNVYNVDSATTSTLISLAGLLNILFYFVAGWWMAKSSALTVFTAGTTLRLVGSLGMALLGMVAKSPALLAIAAMQILYQGNPFSRLGQSAVAVRFATVPPGLANGWVLGASAAGSFVGSVIGGFLADSVGFNAISWMGAIAAGVAVALLMLVMWPAERRKRKSETAPEAA